MVAYQASASGAEFVVLVTHNNRAIREFNEGGQRVCRIPFNSEYKLRIKSKTWRKALVSVTIDGMDVLTGGKQLILNPYQSIELERFVDDLNSGNKFKFISVEQGAKTGEVQDPTAIENGLIHVQIYPETEPPIISYTNVTPTTSFAGGGVLRGMTSHLNNAVAGSVGGGTYHVSSAIGGSFVEACNSSGCTANFVSAVNAVSDKGATAAGSASTQRFQVQTADFHVETTPVTFALWLKGVRSELSGIQCRDLVIHAKSMTMNFMGGIHRVGSFEVHPDGSVAVRTEGGATVNSPTVVIEND